MALMIVLLAAGLIGLLVLRRYPNPGALGPVGRSWKLWAAFVLGGLFVGAALALLDGHPENNAFRNALRVLVPRGAVDSWAPMLEAIRLLRENPGERIYQVLFFERHMKFQYPLTSLVGLDLIQRAFSTSTETMIVAAQVASRACVPLIGWVFASLLIDSARATGKATHKPLSLVAWLGAIAAGTVSAMLFYPIALSETLGQIQTIMTFLAALALWAWQRGARGLAGVCIGLCVIVKPHWLVIVPWAMLRRQWGFTVAAVVTIGVFSVAAVVLYGLRNVLDYAAVASFIGQRGEAYFDNQTVNGLINRLLFNGSNLVWTNDSFAPYHSVVYVVTLATTVLLLCFGLFFGMKREPTALQLGLVMLALTMASPIAWTHHYGVLFPIFALMLPAALAYQPWGRMTIPALFVGYALVSQSWVDATRPLAGSLWNPLQSYVFIGGLLLLVLLQALVRSSAPVPAQATLGLKSATGERRRTLA